MYEVCEMSMITFDIEVFPNWWCVCYKVDDEPIKDLTSDDKDVQYILNKLRIGNILVGFNIKNYDLKILYAIFKGATCERLYKLSKSIIEENPDEVLNSYKFWNEFNFIDLFDDWRFGSLKEFESNIGLDIRETTISFDDKITTDAQKEEVLRYCHHDVEATVKLKEYRKSYIESKEVLAEMYDIPVMQAYKSTNAKLAAIILKAKPRKFHDSDKFHLPEKVKDYVEQALPEEVLRMFDTISYDKKETFLFDNAVIFGVGGVHSVYKHPDWDDVKPTYTMSEEDWQLINVDVNSYYPNMLIHFNLLSRCCESVKVYKDIYEYRLHWKQEASNELKRNGKTEYYYSCQAKQKALKLVLNTTYGAMKNQFNALYDPYMAGTMCYLGQILLTALANNLYTKVPTVKIIQLNTDGIMLKVKKQYICEIEKLVNEWETLTELSMEFDYVAGMFQRDVNNYIELTGDDHKPYKLKGKWSNQADEDRDLVNLNAPITHLAILNFYTKGISVEDTIHAGTNPMDFCFTTKTGRSYNATVYEIGKSYVDANRVNRVVATKDHSKGTIYKYKNEQPAKPKMPTDKDSDSVWRKYFRELDKWEKRKSAFESITGLPFGRLDKTAEIPEHCELVNDVITELPKDIDYDWYIQFAKNKIKELIKI